MNKQTVHVKHCGREEEMVVDERYSVKEVLGSGVSGIVVRGHDSESGEDVAIKKLTWVGGSGTALSDAGRTLVAKRTLRELGIQAVLDHPNILRLRDVMWIAEDEADSFSELYLVVELAEVDLREVLVSGQELTRDHVVYFVYQILKGLMYLHSAGCMHRDLKPSNCLTDASCNIKICDFGLAKQHIVPDYEAVVVTRAYRAPELFLDPYNYSEAIDMWSLGIMVVELMTRSSTPFLSRPTDLGQLNAILDTFGPPPPDLVSSYPPDAANYVQNYSYPAISPLWDLFPDADRDLLDLATRLLDMDWRTRISAAEALSLPLFTHAPFHDPESEIVAPHPLPPFDFELAPSLDNSTIRALLYNEMLRFHHPHSYIPDLYSTLHPPPASSRPESPPPDLPTSMAMSPNYAFGPPSPAFSDTSPDTSPTLPQDMALATPTLL